VFQSRQIDRLEIYRLKDQFDVVEIPKAALGIDWLGLMRQISTIFIESADISSKEDIHSL